MLWLNKFNMSFSLLFKYTSYLAEILMDLLSFLAEQLKPTTKDKPPFLSDVCHILSNDLVVINTPQIYFSFIIICSMPLHIYKTANKEK